MQTQQIKQIMPRLMAIEILLNLMCDDLERNNEQLSTQTIQVNLSILDKKVHKEAMADYLTEDE